MKPTLIFEDGNVFIELVDSSGNKVRHEVNYACLVTSIELMASTIQMCNEDVNLRCQLVDECTAVMKGQNGTLVRVQVIRKAV